MVEHLKQKFRSDEAIYCSFVPRFMTALYTLESCAWETNQYNNKTEIVPNIFLAFDFEGTAVPTEIYRSSNSADLTTDRADAKLREVVYKSERFMESSSPKNTWYGTGVLDWTENFTEPQWQLPLSSTGIVLVKDALQKRTLACSCNDVIQESRAHRPPTQGI